MWDVGKFFFIYPLSRSDIEGGSKRALQSLWLRVDIEVSRIIFALFYVKSKDLVTCISDVKYMGSRLEMNAPNSLQWHKKRFQRNVL